ncbi:hypothetical protein A5660_10345, partial [Mycobacterium alsense]|uniref:DUF6779 domain-containing protein n=1 Tax=Mycobacterium alsense TaxID=324058 RepID=UPI0007FD48FC
MTVLSRGARARRGGRRPGWVLLTALLVLAMGASSALVFTNRVELLKLAVILALWAAVAGAFVSVLYRRQSDADQSRVRDLKLVYDLQLDREISARREYELTVESQLRRELASEFRAQAADDLAALRAELSALRTSLEILFDTDLEHHPALETHETEAPRARAYGDWERNGEANRDWVSSDRMTSVSRPDEASIIDVPEEPLLPPRQQPSAPRASAQQSPWGRPAPPPPPPEPQPQPQPQPHEWQPAAAQGQWMPPGTTGGNWSGADPVGVPNGEPPAGARTRHYDMQDMQDMHDVQAMQEPRESDAGRRARARHSAEYRDNTFAATNEAAPPPPPPWPPPRCAPPPTGAASPGR